jgi:hypothetical protein
MSSPNAQHHLSKELEQVRAGLNGQDTTLGALVDEIGERGFGLLFLVLALPAALPLPAPGYATPFGIVMALLGGQMFLGRPTPWLPEAARKRRLSYGLVDFSIRHGARLLAVVEWIVRPRIRSLARNRVFLRAVAVLVVVMSLFMMLPIPLTNTAPSFVIFVLAAGILEEDGLLLLAGLLLAPVAAVISIAALVFGMRYGLDAVEETVKPWLRSLWGG